MSNISTADLMKCHIPPSHFNYAVEEVKERLKICTAIGSFIEDVADVENVMSKALLRIGSQQTIVRYDNCPGIPFIDVWDAIFKAFTVQYGKQHGNLQANLSQNIGRAFPESMKALKKSVKAQSYSVTGICEEYRKSKSNYKKTFEKYLRFSAEAEASVKMKDNSLSVIQDNTLETRETWEDSFINLSLPKMLKSTPNEKKLIERCRDMIRDFEFCEKSVINMYEQLSEQHENLHLSIKKSLEELSNVEVSRYLLMKEGLSRLFLAEDLLIEYVDETQLTITKQIAAVSALILLPDITLVQTDISTNLQSWSDEELLNKFTAHAEKLLEFVEFIKLTATSIRQFIGDIIDASKAYQKGMQRVLEKHGFSKFASPSTSHMRSALSSQLFSSSCADLLSTMESPSMRLVWEAIVRAFGGFAEMHGKLADMMQDKIYVPLESCSRRLEEYRKDLQEKLSFHSKRVSTGQANVLRIVQKLIKVQKDILEKKTALKKSREEEILANSSASGDPARAISPSASETNPSGMKVRENLSSLRSSSLSVVVGLETPADRINRIEQKISSLEMEEATCKDSLEACKSSLYGIFDNLKSDVKGSMCVCIANLINESSALFDAEKVFVDIQIAGLQLRKHALTDARVCYESTDLERDLFYVVKLIQTTAKTQEDENDDSLLLDVAMVEELTLYSSPTLDAERRLQTTLSPSIPTLVKEKSENSTAIESIDEKNFVNSKQMENRDDILNYKLLENESDSDSDSGENMTPDSEGKHETILQNISDVYVDSNYARSPVDSNENPKRLVSSAVAVDNALKNEEDNRSNSAVTPKVSLKDDRNHIVKSAVVPVGLGHAVYLKDMAQSPSGKSLSKGQLTPSRVHRQAQILNLTHPKDHSDINELSKFGLSSADKILESYSCALYPKRGMLTHGRMYVTQNFMAFSGWPDTRVLLALADILIVEKSNTLVYVPNALVIKARNDNEYFFASFLDRDQCYNLLTRLSEVAKRLVDLHGPNTLVTGRNLVFGFQSNFTSITGNSTAGVIMSALSIASSSMNEMNENVRQRSLSDTRIEESTSNRLAISNNNLDISNATEENKSANSSSESAFNAAVSEDVHFSSKSTSSLTIATTQMNSDKSSKRSSALGLSISSLSGRIPSTEESLLPFEEIFKKNAVISLGEYNFPAVPMHHYFTSYWRHIDGHRTFLESLGDFDITMTDWHPLEKDKSIQHEDILKLSFQYSRRMEFLHPRTSLLMFGPKNAPGKQRQFLYLNPESMTIDSVRPVQGVVMTITQFDGIPLGDVFRVVQYWLFENLKGSEICTIVRVGLHIHMVHTSMFRGQIINGTKDELDEQLKKWYPFTKNYLVTGLTSKVTDDTATVEPSVETESPRLSRNNSIIVTPRRRSSLLEFTTEAVSDVVSKLTGKSTLQTPTPSSDLGNEGTSNKTLIMIIIFLIVLVCVQYQNNRLLRLSYGDLSKRLKNLEDLTVENIKYQKIIFKRLNITSQ